MAESTEEIFDSTLIRRASDATTFGEMVDYAAWLEERPIEELIRDLPAVALLSRSKFDLTLVVLRRRLRIEPPQTQRKILTVADHVARNTKDPEVRGAVLGLFA